MSTIKERIETVTSTLNEATQEINNLPDYFDTSDSTASMLDIRKGKIAYGKGEPIVGSATFPEIVTDTYTGELTRLSTTIADPMKFSYWRQNETEGQYFTITNTLLACNYVSQEISSSIVLKHSNPTSIAVGFKNLFQENSCVIGVIYNTEKLIDFYLYDFETNTFTFKKSNDTIKNLPDDIELAYYHMSLNIDRDNMSISCLDRYVQLQVLGDYSIIYLNNTLNTGGTAGTYYYCISFRSFNVQNGFRVATDNIAKSSWQYSSTLIFTDNDYNLKEVKVSGKSFYDIHSSGKYVVVAASSSSWYGVCLYGINKTTSGAYSSVYAIRDLQGGDGSSAFWITSLASGFITDDYVVFTGYGSRDSSSTYWYGRLNGNSWTFTKASAYPCYTLPCPHNTRYKVLTSMSSITTISSNRWFPILNGTSYVKKFVYNDTDYVGKNNCTANTNNILSGTTAVTSTGLVTGTMANNGTLNYIPTTSQQTIPAGYTSGGTISAVDNTIDANIIAENIKKDVTILNVTGTLEEGIDTSDATATENDIEIGKSAYAGGQKIEGTLSLGTSIGANLTSATESGNYIKLTSTMSEKIIIAQGSPIELGIRKDYLARDIGLTANKIKSGETILGIAGDSNVIDTSLITNEPEYTTEGERLFVWDEEQNYWHLPAGSTNGYVYLHIAFSLNQSSDVILSYKGNILTGGMSATYLLVDNVEYETLSSMSEYTDTLIENLSEGDHTITIRVISDSNKTEMFVKPLDIPGEIGITPDTITSGSVGYVNGQKILGAANVMNTTVGGDEPIYTTDDVDDTFEYNEENDYWHYINDVSTIKLRNLNIEFNLKESTNITITYKGSKLISDESFAQILVDEEQYESLGNSQEFTDKIINNLDPGNHKITIQVSTNTAGTEIYVKPLNIPIEIPITSDTVLKDNIGFVNGQKVIGTYEAQNKINFYLGDTKMQRSLSIEDWPTASSDLKVGTIGWAISDYEIISTREPEDFEVNGNWCVYFPKTYSFATPITSSLQSEANFNIVGSYNSSYSLKIKVDSENNYYAIYLSDDMNYTPFMFGLASSNGQDFTLKKYNSETYMYDLDSSDSISVQPIYVDKTLCAPNLNHETFSFVKLKAFDLNFYKMLLGTNIKVKNNIIAEFDGTSWNNL